MVDFDIRTRVVLENETIHSTVNPGMAGKVALIGAFPSKDMNVFACQSLTQLYSHYNIDKNDINDTSYDGVIAAKRLFMNGFTGYSGASSITCVNITSAYTEGNTLIVNKNGKETVNDNSKLTFQKLDDALHKIADEDLDLLFISSDLTYAANDGTKKTVTTSTGTVQVNRNIADVYNHIIDFIDNEFTSHRPSNFVGTIYGCTTDIANCQPSGGIPSTTINVTGNLYESGDTIPTGYAEGDVKTYGVNQIAKLFTRENNELSTCGLFYQSGTINGVTVNPMEFAAHMCGWIASLPVSQDLTYQTIPGVTGVNEEVYFGENDAGLIINSYGVNVIKPKNRLTKTYYVNNSITPSGWHTNHVRSMTYLLKQYSFEAGLGINNFTTNVEAFKTSLENVTKEVMNSVDTIRDVTIGDVEVINNYEIYVPIDVTLAGVVTKINVGVNMVLDETGSVSSTSSSDGYDVYY